MYAKPNFRFDIVQFCQMVKAGTIRKSDIDEHTRRLVVQYLRFESNLTHTEIGTFLGVSRQTVIRDLNWMKKNAMKSLAPFVTKEIAKDLWVESESLIERARKAEDHRLEWKIRRERIVILGKMGVLNDGQERPALPGPDDPVPADAARGPVETFAYMSDEEKAKLRQSLIESGAIKDPMLLTGPVGVSTGAPAVVDVVARETETPNPETKAAPDETPPTTA